VNELRAGRLPAFLQDREKSGDDHRGLEALAHDHQEREPEDRQPGRRPMRSRGSIEQREELRRRRLSLRVASLERGAGGGERRFELGHHLAVTRA
jgi:hypothetical protein